jgi:mRNA-degrading endonuclease toxin of MazEF toxin-antitoxin module
MTNGSKPEDEFTAWNIIKKKIDTQTKVDKFPKEGEIWMSSVGRNIGFEQNGSGNNFSHPVLVTKKFNNHMFWAIPLSAKQKKYDFYFNFTDPDQKNVSAILAQMKLMSVKRLNRKLYELSPDLVVRVKEKLKKFL